jgi:hypothetical protein
MLYPQLLQDDFAKLPRALRNFHSTPGGGRASGTVVVERVNRWLAGLMGFPREGKGIPLELRVIAQANEEIWLRRVDGVERRTLQRQQGDLLLETAGPVRILFRVFADQAGMRFQLERARFWIIPIPLRIEAHAWGNDASWNFKVTVAGVGSYEGTMVPAV